MGRESSSDCAARAERVVEWLTGMLAQQSCSARIILVGHSDFMSAVLSRVLGMPREGIFIHANTGISMLRYVRSKGDLNIDIRFLFGHSQGNPHYRRFYGAFIK